MKSARAFLIATALVLTAAKATAAEQCAGNMAELANAPELQRILVSFGGHQNLAGGWKLSGLAGSFVQAKVKFENLQTSFVTQVNSEPVSRIQVCTHDDQLTLKLIVLNPQDPNNKIMYVRAIEGQTDKIMISAHASKWKFVKFKRAKSVHEQPHQIAAKI